MNMFGRESDGKTKVWILTVCETIISELDTEEREEILYLWAETRDGNFFMSKKLST